MTNEQIARDRIISGFCKMQLQKPLKGLYNSFTSSTRVRRPASVHNVCKRTYYFTEKCN